jgi:outer membrane biosynthesis protein TonB
MITHDKALKGKRFLYESNNHTMKKCWYCDASKALQEAKKNAAEKLKEKQKRRRRKKKKEEERRRKKKKEEERRRKKKKEEERRRKKKKEEERRRKKEKEEEKQNVQGATSQEQCGISVTRFSRVSKPPVCLIEEACSLIKEYYKTNSMEITWSWSAS